MNDKIKKIGDLITQFFAKETPKQDYTLADGKILSITGKVKAGSHCAFGAEVAKDESYLLPDGTTITVKAGVIESVKLKEVKLEKEPVLMTAENLKALKEKFAAGTPEERIANLEIMAEALMQYAFGWQLNEAAQKSAIAVYQSNFEAQKKEIGEIKAKSELDLKASNEKIVAQAEILKATFSLMEEMAATTEKPAEPVKNPFARQKPNPTDITKQIANTLLELRKNKE